MYGSKIYDTHKELVESIGDYEIYKKYLGNFKVGDIFNSPLRTDRNPSFGIFYSRSDKNRLRWKDLSTGETGDVVEFVKKLHNCEYIKAIDLIRSDLKGYLGKSNTNMPLSGKTSGETLIRVISRDWNSGMDKVYWSQYCLNCEILNKFEVIPIGSLYINGILTYTHSNKNPAYAYKIDEGIYKILLPYNTYKWISNCKSYHYQGYNQLPLVGDLLVITKSLKDVMVLDIFNIPAIAPQSESLLIDEDFIRILNKRFNRIVIFYDNDNPGISGASKNCDKYNLESVIIPTEFSVKDISDYIRNYGMNKTEILINSLI